MNKPRTSSDDIVLIPFGPTRAVPENHRWCFACDGSGKTYIEEQPCCEVCKGKGHWNAEDIRDHHAKYPEICRQTCGAMHIEPSFNTPEQIDKEIKSLMKRTDAFIAKIQNDRKDT